MLTVHHLNNSRSQRVLWLLVSYLGAISANHDCVYLRNQEELLSLIQIYVILITRRRLLQNDLRRCVKTLWLPSRHQPALSLERWRSTCPSPLTPSCGNRRRKTSTTRSVCEDRLDKQLRTLPPACQAWRTSARSCQMRLPQG